MILRRTIALLLLTGCGFFSRTKSQFFSLDTIPPAAPAAAASGLPIGIEAVELPPGFDRKEMIIRRDKDRLELRETHQWTASLESMVLHTLAFDLAGRLPEGMVVLPGQAKPAGGMRSIDLVFEELAAGPQPTVVLDVRWVMRETGRTGHERITVDLASLDSAAIASGMSHALATLADRIVAAL
jgi:uncharacterized lipoprotein YmbA